MSIIIPAVNEARAIEKTLASTQTGTNVEVIVVDGGSQDDTVAIASAWGAKVLSVPQGRAKQMNLGATAATGEILLFLHADTLLPFGFDAMVRAAIAQPHAIAGAFRLQIDSPLSSLRLIEWGVNWRSRLLKMPYGDQAIFIRSSVFHQLGKFPELPMMEDFELMRRLQRKGRIVILPTPVLTSPRRWLKQGVCQTTLKNQIAIISYLLGVAPAKIAAWYRGKSSS
ncbi:TIGR04283 family arsenosugar biosynthesis glycosyltransferase [Scytonema millei]|uniref:4,4'-diaponeurosporenoate glycosyltransferase n=1 Tax=Scytonema millei VB511283 TaxID=1245923 RepID=A0A9X5I6Y8_9CYAN|nr:TIGR04283 family arsenosugar biosynthesis glycosyltransferase [Scytonema millei]NHC37022.1 glycosyltransferase family 2 protein [Scytonema millei VB511283]